MTFTIADMSIGAVQLGVEEYGREYPIMASPGLAVMRNECLRQYHAGTLDEFKRTHPTFCKLAGIKGVTSGSMRYFITVNMPKGTDPYTFYERVSFMSFLWARKYTACIEHLNTNIHAHLLVDKTHKQTRPSQIVRDLARHFSLAPNFIDVKGSKDDDLNTLRLAYINGDKTDDKMEDVEDDIREREKLNIPHVFNNSLSQITPPTM